jgi:parvulin-like peptidyl-prolyl isomerase
MPDVTLKSAFRICTQRKGLPMKPLILICSILSLTSFTQAQESSDSILAKAGNKTITLEEFKSKFNEVSKKAANPPSREAFLEDFIRYHIGLQEAQKQNLHKDPLVQDRMQQEVYKALLEKELTDSVNKISVQEKDMKEYYKKNPEIRSSHILIEFKLGANSSQKQEAQKRALEIYEEVKKSKRPFPELVKLYSDDTLTKQNGGDLGFQSRATLLPHFYETILAMKPNEIKGVVESPYGYHIIKVTDRRSFENANKRQLRALVFDEKRKEIFDRYFDTLKKSYPVSVNKSLIRK